MRLAFAPRFLAVATVVASLPGCTPPDGTPPDGGRTGRVDCAAVPDEATAESVVDGARGYKGLAFDDAGNILGTDSDALFKATRDGQSAVFLPGVGEIEQMVYLPDGDLVVTSSWSSGHVQRITPEGGIRTLVSGLYAYSILLGPDGMLYGAGWNGAYRIDPDSGDVDTLLRTEDDEEWSARTVAFNADASRLYMGTVDDDGRIFYFDLDDDMNTVGEPRLHARGVGNGWHDGLGFDACGSLFAADYETSSLYRVSPDGSDVARVADWSSDSSLFGHGLVWGTGEDGWRDDALYMPMPAGGSRVKELVVGVPSQAWDGEVID